MSSLLCRLGFHQWLAWSHPRKHHIYCRLLGGNNVEIVSEVRPGPFDYDLGEHTIQTRWCDRCKCQEQRRV